MLKDEEKKWVTLDKLYLSILIYAIIIIYALSKGEKDYLDYAFHKSDYTVEMGSITEIYEYVYSNFRGKHYMTYSKVKLSDQSIIEVITDEGDFVGKMIPVAIRADGKVQRTQFIRFKSHLTFIFVFFSLLSIFLLVIKGICIVKTKRILDRLDREYIGKVKKELGQTETGEDITVIKVKRGFDKTATFETVQLICLAEKSNKKIKSPKMIGHTYLKKGDRIKAKEGQEPSDRQIDWSLYVD